MARRKKGKPINGWAIVDKPLEITSTQVVGKLKRAFDAQKVGHGGTLDPLATGLLPVAFGEATKTVPFVMDGLKTYRFTAHWGEARDTDDREGDVIATSAVRPSEDALDKALDGFLGDIEQVPPRYSAIKVQGERAYDLARAGETVELKKRWVWVEEIALVDIPDADHAVLSVTCGKGFYIRSFVRDLAEALGTVGHVSELRRTGVGPFTEADALPLDKWLELSHSAPASEVLLPVETALDDIPALAVTAPDASRLKRGQGILVRGQPNWVREPGMSPDVDGSDATVLASFKGQPIALCSFHGMELRPTRVFNLT
jgi:tRNA pseudouridine55 synthase